MRPGDAIFQGQEGLPTWAVTLIRELGKGGKEASPVARGFQVQRVLVDVPQMTERARSCRTGPHRSKFVS
jgi:hypothetical protein